MSTKPPPPTLAAIIHDMPVRVGGEVRLFITDPDFARQFASAIMGARYAIVGLNLYDPLRADPQIANIFELPPAGSDKEIGFFGTVLGCKLYSEWFTRYPKMIHRNALIVIRDTESRYYYVENLNEASQP